MIIPVVTLPKEWFEEQAKANFDLAKAYMDGFEAGKKAAREESSDEVGKGDDADSS